MPGSTWYVIQHCPHSAAAKIAAGTPLCIADPGVILALLSPAGIRYSFIGKSVEQRASYGVLGRLLFMQLAITASLGAIDALSKSLTPQAQSHGDGAQGDKDGHAVVLQVMRCVVHGGRLSGRSNCYRAILVSNIAGHCHVKFA